MKKLPILLILLTITFHNVFAQKRDTTLFNQVINHGLNDAKDYVLSPISWEKKQWLTVGGLAATTGALILWGDQPIYDFTNTMHSSSLDILSHNLEPIGNTYSYLALGAIMLKGVIQKDNYALETGFIALESYVAGAIFTRGVKALAGRARPNYEGTTDAHNWYGPFIENPFFNHVSFFSGHTTTTFSIASVFAYRYRDTEWVPYVAYGLATLGGLQRIYDNRHWTSDVLVGAAIGTATGIFLSKQWEKNSIKFYPSVSTNGAGLALVIPIN